MSLTKPTLIVLALVGAAIITAACGSGTAVNPQPSGNVGPPAGGPANADTTTQNIVPVAQNGNSLAGAAGAPVVKEPDPEPSDASGGGTSDSGTARPIDWSDNVTVTIDESAGTMTINSDGLPEHAIGDWSILANPRAVIAQNLSYTLPLNPQIAASTSDVPMGPIGIMINGVVFFNAYNAQREDAVISEATDFDDCLGHPDPMRGLYHYHQNPICLVDDDPGQHSYLIGFAFDGFPVYGPQGDGGATPTDLDVCNGHTGATPEYPEGTYHYHVTSTFPYILGCYSGTSAVAGPGR